MSEFSSLRLSLWSLKNKGVFILFTAVMLAGLCNSLFFFRRVHVGEVEQIFGTLHHHQLHGDLLLLDSITPPPLLHFIKSPNKL